MRNRQTLDEKSINVRISGSVTGVGFRYFTNRLASIFNLTGYVRNCPEGDVEVVAEGCQRDLNDFVKQLKNGPKTSRIDSVDIEWGDYTGRFKEFHIKF
jgi:acylphosphatase